MRSYLLTMMIIASLPLIVAKPFVGVLVYSWFGFMNPHRLTYGFANHIPFAMIIGVVTIGAWLISTESKKLPLTPLSVLILSFAFWINLTTLFAVVPESASLKWDTVNKILLIMFLTMILLTTQARINALIWVIAVSLGFYGIKGGLFMLATGGSHRVFGPDNSFIADNNALALALVMTLPLMRQLQVHARSRFVRLSLVGSMALCGLSVLGSFSRGAALAGGSMLFVMILRSRRRVPLLLALIAALGIGLLFMPPKFYDRLATLGTIDQDESANSRLDTWRFTFDYALTSPIVGGGFSVFDSLELRETFDLDTRKTYNAHSIWFEVLGEHGFVGLFMFVGIGFVALVTCGRIRKLTRGDPDHVWWFDLASNLQVSLVGFAVGGTFLNKAYFDLYWQILAIVVALSVVARQSETASEMAKSNHPHAPSRAHASTSPGMASAPETS